MNGIKLEVGKFYRTADGRKAGPMSWENRSYLFCGEVDGRLYTYTQCGAHYNGPSALDIVAEWTDAPDAPARLDGFTPWQLGYDALTAERDGLIQTSAAMCDDCGWSMKFPDCGCVYCGFHRLEKERDALTTDNARLRDVLQDMLTYGHDTHGTQVTLARAAARAALNTGKEPSHE